MDGLKHFIDQVPNEIIQSCFSNGWKSAYFVTTVYVFPIWNYTGSFLQASRVLPDNQVADWGNIYKNVRQCMFILD